MNYQITPRLQGTRLDPVYVSAPSASEAIKQVQKQLKDKSDVYINPETHKVIVHRWSGYTYEARRITSD